MKTVRLERQQGLLVVRLEKSRGNAIDPALVEDLRESIGEAARDDGVRGVLLASAHPRLFCPGLDLVTLSAMDRGGLQVFMTRFVDMVRELYALPKPMVAAIAGHAVAGGCILALTADWRVLAAGASIGLNEVKIGLPLPWSVALILRAAVTPAALGRVALLGRNLADQDAVDAGMVDELAPASGVEAAGLARLAEFAEKDPRAVAVTKAYLRSSVLGEMKTREAEELPVFLDAWFSPDTQERIGTIIESLGRSSP
jgi:enoyl-CoA hydratase/carnithine racemase